MSLVIYVMAGGSPPAASQISKKAKVALVLTEISDVQLSGPDPAFAPARAFVHELRELGWLEGQNISIERLTLEGSPQRAPALFSELLARGVDVIALGGARWLHEAALSATKSTPLVTIFQDDPVAAGLIASLARPGGNLTGVAQTTGPEFFRKRLQLLKEMAPQVSRVAFLGPKGVLDQDSQVTAAAGITILPVQIDVADELDTAFDVIRRQQSDGLMVAGSAITYGHYRRIVVFSAENGLPTIHSFREAVEGGGLMSYGTSIPGIFRQMARLTNQILKGTQPQELPVEQATIFELVVNTKTAKALGLVVPPTMLALADDVI